MCEADLGEGTTDECARCRKAAMEHGTGTPADTNVPRLEHLERQDRCVHQVPEFVREETQALTPAGGLAVNARLCSLAPVLGHRARRWHRPDSGSASESRWC